MKPLNLVLKLFNTIYIDLLNSTMIGKQEKSSVDKLF